MDRYGFINEHISKNASEIAYATASLLCSNLILQIFFLLNHGRGV